MLNLLADRLADWQPLLPAGGASMWVRLPEGYSATTTVERAARAGIDVLPGPTFSSENALDNFLRLSFAIPAESLISGIDGLAAVWRNMCASHAGPV